MTEILTAVIPVVIIGVICAAVLVVASKIMAVKEDERFPKVRECLPGANCGACGYAGCDGYAKALCEDGSVPTNLCIPGADGVAKQLSEVLGVEFEDVVEQVAVVHCSGDCEHTQDKVEYQGIETCAAAKLLYGGKGSCTYGCLGLGDCQRACPHGAICIENGIARINTRQCIGCGVCAKACPNHLISLVADVERVVVEPKEGAPADPHKTGVWLVTINKDGGEEWKEMMWDDGDYTAIIRFEYGTYGTFPYNPALRMEENAAMRPNVSYYIVVDGIRYGANADGTLTVLGEALNNPLYEGDNLYVLEHAVGRVYQMGVAFDPENDDMYVYAAVAAYTDVEEMNAAKTVAGVRYFNMAGQEMQKAEGMTIVVTTYTDGTTSAVKVMK